MIAAARDGNRRPHKNLTRAQEEVAAVASDILLNGGAKEDLDSILTALLRHQYKGMSSTRGLYGAKPAELEEKAKAFANNHKDNYYQQLCKHWPEKRQETEEEPSDRERPVVEMMRANVRASLREKVDELLTDARDIETIWLLNEIVEDINSGEEPGEAIWRAMDRADIYVRVPWEHKKRIEEFVAFLEKGKAA